MQHPLHEHVLQEIDPTTIYQEYNGLWKCDNCGSTPGSTVFPKHCNICAFDLCHVCYNGHQHPRHGHRLYFMAMANVYPEYQGQWKCDACGSAQSDMPSRYQSHAYHCPICKLDICRECFQGRMYPIHQHPLQPADAINIYGHSTGLWVCDSCKRNGEQIGSQYSWHCSECEFDACSDCLRDQFIPSHPHPLKITDCNLAYPQFSGGWKCDFCRNVGGSRVPNMDKPYHCELCEFDACKSCVRADRLNRSIGSLIGADVAGPPPNMFIPFPVSMRGGAHHHPPVEDQVIDTLPVEFLEDTDEIPPNLDDSQKCIICTEKPKNATIVHGHTGHVCCCIGCANTLKLRRDKCPICRAPIDRVIRHYDA